MGFLQVVHNLSLSLWVGGMVLYSFVITPAFFQKLSREQAGEMVGLLFPRYWLFGYCGAGLSFLSYVWLRFLFKTPPWGDKARLIVLFLLLAGVIVNGVFISSKAHDVKERIAKAASEAEKADLRQEFGKLHGISMAVNLAVIIGGLALLGIAAVHPVAPGALIRKGLF